MLSQNQVDNSDGSLLRSMRKLEWYVMARIEAHPVFNMNAANALPRGTIVKLVHHDAGITGAVAPAQGGVTGGESPVQNDTDYFGVIYTASIAAHRWGVAAYSGVAFVLMQDSQTLAVGDKIILGNGANTGFGKEAGVLVNEDVDIFIGTVVDLGNYSGTATTGTTGCYVQLRYACMQVGVGG